MIEARNLTVTYHGADEPTLVNVDFSVAPGELVLVCGASGSGKSTLLLGLNGVLHHESSARIQGEIRLGGLPIQNVPMKEICNKVGTVFQNPAAQICTDTPEREVAFGLENLCVPKSEMAARIDEALELTGLTEVRHQNTRTLSGGQQQRLIIAAVIAQRPDVLLLDEPVSQLDPAGAQSILELLSELRRSLNIAVVLVEHRLEGPLRTANHVVVLERGRVFCEASPGEILFDLSSLRRLGIGTPPLCDLFDRVERDERPLQAEAAPLLVPRRASPITGERRRRERFVKICNVSFTYEKKGPRALSGLSLVIHRGDRIAVLGTNGAGKTTLLHLLAGLLKPDAGTIERPSSERESIGLLMQNPDVMLIAETVERELSFTPRQLGTDRAETAETVRAVVERMSLDDLISRAPFALSRGERQRTAVGSVLTGKPSLLLLDEPTTGQDRARIERMMSSIMDDCDAVLFSTHDVETAARHANRVVLLHRGRLVADGLPDKVLFDWEALETASVRPSQIHLFAARHDLSALTVESLVEVFRQ